METTKKVNVSFFQLNLKQSIFTVVLFLITSCNMHQQLTKTTPTRTDSSRQLNTNIDVSKMTRFERAVYNSWNDLSEEDKTFFKECLIGDTSKIKK